MKSIRAIALMTAAALILAACGKEPDSSTVAMTTGSNPLLAYVPADTAYVFADLEAIPQTITDAYIARFQPVMDVVTEQVSQFLSAYKAGEYEGDTAAELATAILDELGGSISVENLEKLGISLKAHHAFYAMGVFPVARFEIQDTQKLRAALARIESKMGFDIPEHSLNGSAYWRLAEESSPAGLYIAILDQQLALGVFPLTAEEKLLPALLGQEMPTNSIASSNALAIMNKEKGYSSYGSGFLDLQKIAQQLLNPNSTTRSYLDVDSGLTFPNLDETCVAELNAIVARAPRMTGGTTKLTANEIAMRYDLEFDTTLAEDLAGLVASIPAAVDGSHLLSASLALQVGKLRSFMLDRANAIVATPYQCAMLQELNQNADTMLTQLSVPMPPMVNNLMGARILVEDVNPATEPPEVTGLLALHVEKPEMLVGMASMMIPGFERLELNGQSEPVKVPEEILRMEGLEVFALVGDSTIGASIGAGQSSGLAAFLAEKPQSDGTFLSVSYDPVRQMEIQNQISDKWNSEPAAEDSPLHGLSAAIKDSYAATLDRGRVDMRFTADGLVIDSRVTFK